MTDPTLWLVLLSLGMPGPVTLTQCDQSRRIVGLSKQSTLDVRATTLDDIEFMLDATSWDRERVADLLRWGEHCWTRNGCVVNGKYDPPPPPMKCGVPTS